MQKKEIDDLNYTIKWFKTVRRNNDMACILPDQPMMKNIIKWLEKLKERESRLEDEWIPVSERLPEESDYYMTCIYNEILNKYYCRSERFSINNNYCGELVWIDLESYEKVVAWMSLPEPYKEK